MNLPSRPGPRPLHPTPGPRAGHDPFAGQRLVRAAALERYDLGVLRLGGLAPPTLLRGAHTTARDGDLARVEAQQRYARQLITRQQHAASRSGWAALQAGQPAPEPAYAVGPAGPRSTVGRELALQRKIDGNLAQLAADHPLEATVGQGVVIGGTIVTSTAVSEVVLLRLAGGLRWVGATRAAAVARSLTLEGAAHTAEAARSLTWAGAEKGLFGVRAGWQGLREAPMLAVRRGGIDFAGQGIISYSGSNESGLRRIIDATQGINVTELGLSAYGMRPFGASLFSAGFQYSINDGYRSVFNHRVSTRTFLAQTAIGAGVGYAGEFGGRVFGRHLAYSLYRGVAERAGDGLGYPVWLGSKYAFQYGLPTGFGTLAGYGQAWADHKWPGLPETPPPAPPKP
ncbi:hypothetical protein [Hymenobacter psoromatis]|uniref:hypothetical protein n=1 Tax=Hymenobacter psoromatis TaxID=1484116 RepID=UPI001CBB7C8F|nr:hypothetical protein [Hymenobacter psoromatis]